LEDLIYDGGYMKRIKGFTLIEIILTIGFMSIIVSSIIFFLIININNFDVLRTDAELQFHSQYIMNFVSNKIMESKNVEVIKNGTKDVMNGRREYSITKISLRYGTNNNNCYTFEIRNNKIYYGNSNSYDSADTELGTYIKELKVSPYPSGATFEQSNALVLTICMLDNGQEYTAKQIIYMRNS